MLPCVPDWAKSQRVGAVGLPSGEGRSGNPATCCGRKLKAGAGD